MNPIKPQPATSPALSRWQVFTAAPHRLWFFFGASHLILSIGWWFFHLLGRDIGSPVLLHSSVVPSWSHAYLMLYGVFSFFIFGFLMTVYPRWLQTRVIPRKLYLPAALLLSTGYLACFLGFITSQMLAAIGALIMLAGWSIALLAFVGVLNQAERIIAHAWVTTLGLIAGWIGVFMLACWLLMDNTTFRTELIQTGIQLGIWGYLLPIYFAVSHRMVPFFSQVAVQVNYTAYRPRWSLPCFVAASLLHLVLETQALRTWMLISDIPLFIIALQHSLKWQPHRCLKTSILASLHIGFAWLWIAMGLLVAQDIVFLVNGNLIIALAPLHALTIGFFTTMLVAMATRVTMGHSGNPLHMDSITWLIFLTVQATALTRIAAAIPALNHLPFISLNTVAALLWLACLIPWVVKYAPIYLKPRADQQPG